MAEETANQPTNMTSEGLNYFQPQPTDNALKIRLETEDTLEKIEMYLRGEAWAYNQAGELTKILEDDPKANEKGVRALMSVLHSYVNKSAVQGNLSTEQVNNLMVDFHLGMGNLLGFHCSEWGIDRNDRRSIVNFIEPFVFMFISRTKDNKERDSYGMRVTQTAQRVLDNTKKGLFK